MKNWVFEGRNSNLSYSILHTGKDQCGPTSSDPECSKNCKYDTETEYLIENPKFYDSFKLRMTSLDSCNTYRMRVFGIDIYGYFATSFISIKKTSTLYLSILLLIIITVKC